MQNLVSKNPILRFKLGKKIVKAEEGAVAKWQRRIRHPFLSYLNLDRKLDINRMDPFRYLENKINKVGSRIGNDLVVDNYTPENGGTTNNRIRRLRQSLLLQTAMSNASNNNSTTTYGLKQQIFPEQVDSNYTHNFLEALRAGYRPNSDGSWKAPGTTKPQSSSTTKSLTTVKSKPRSGWSYGFDRSKEGIGDIATMLRKLKAEGYYADDENSADDGKWGQSTENAYKRYLAKQKAMELPLEIVPKIINADEVYEKSKDNAVYSFSGKTLPTPDYGYYSPSNYGTLNPRWLKTAGATNIEGFRNLVNTNSQLKNDLLNRYGENWEQYLFDAAGVNANKRHFGRKSRRLINNALLNVVNTLNDNYMDKVRAYDLLYGLYKQGGQLVSRNPIIRFKNKKK